MPTQPRIALCALALAAFAPNALGQAPGVSDPRKSTPTPTPAPTKVHKVGSTTVRKAGGNGLVVPLCNKPAGTNIRKAGGNGLAAPQCNKPAGTNTRKTGGELTPLCNKPAGTHVRKAGGDNLLVPLCNKPTGTNTRKGTTRTEYPNLRKAGGSKTNQPAVQNQNAQGAAKPDAPSASVPK
jgi:hypothetical protein